jgi:6-phosphofructokinase 1
MVKEHLGYKYHWAVADYLQRAARHIASQTDVDQAIALGRAAVELALEGANAIMPTIERKTGKQYGWHIGTAPLHRIANREKKMPRRFISKDGFAVTAAGKAYFEPLIAGEAYPDYHRGMPRYTRLKKVLVRKRCAPWQT